MPSSTSTPRCGGWAPRGRCDPPAAAAARLADRKLARGPGARPLRFCGGGPGDRPLRPGLRRAGAGRGRGRDRPRRQLSRAKSQARLLAPGLSRRADLRRSLLRDRRLIARPVRWRAAAGQLRDPAGRDHELRPQDPPQLLLLDVDQPRHPLSRRGLRVGLRIRRPRGPLGAVPRGFLDCLASQAAERGAQGTRAPGGADAWGGPARRFAVFRPHPAAVRSSRRTCVA